MKDIAGAIAAAQRDLARGDVAAAQQRAAAALRSARRPADQARVHVLLAACAQRSHDARRALQHVRTAIGLDDTDASAHYLCAELQEASGDAAGALASLDRAVALNPSFVQAWFYVGILHGERGDASAAARAFAETVRLDPAHARGWNNLGNALRNLGRADDATAAFRRAVEHKPDYPLAVANLAKALRDRGDVLEAEQVLRDALARPSSGPPYRPLIVLLAGLTRERGFFDESAQLYRRAIEAAPSESAGEWFSLGWVMSERGDIDRARDAYANAYTLDRRDFRPLLGRHLALPMVYSDGAALEHARERFTAGLATLENTVDTVVEGLSPEEVIDGFRWSNFFLAYQGRDDRPLQERYAALIARAVSTRGSPFVAPLARVPVSGRRIRVGFASAFLHVGTVGRYFQSWMTGLPREDFELFVYHLWPGMDDIAHAIAGRADHFRTFGGSEARPSVVAPVVRGDALDILVYPELGMDVSSFALAALRLAPRQYCAWGHPVTTGHRTLDGFISCEAMEPQDAQAQYTEPLVLLPGIGTRYLRPDDVPQDASREALGLPADRVLLLCPQSLFKIHPDNDALFADVLAENAEAMLVLFAGRHPAITDQFMRRLERALSPRGVPIRERVRVLPSLPHADFMRVNRVCDAMLDTLHWSGGNTSLDALACGLPIVTLPGRCMRGRQSAAMLGFMDATALVARDRADYVAIATRLVRDRPWRETMRQHLETRQDRLFGRDDALRALVDFLRAEAAR